MSKLPQLNLRIPADYHGLIRQIAERLRDRDGANFASDLDAFLIGLPQSTRAVALDDALCAVAALNTRVEELEASLGKVMEMVTAQALEPKSTTKRLTRTSPKAARTSSAVE